MSKVLILGSGGREHALAWWFDQYGCNVSVAPGNAGTEELLGDNVNIDPNDFEAVRRFAMGKGIDLVVPGPDALVVNGIVDYWREYDLADDLGIHIFGPSKEGAALEGSKILGMKFARRHGIPVPDFVAFDSHDFNTNLHEATKYLGRFIAENRIGAPLVLKADGLCEGKGVAVCDTPGEVLAAIKELPRFGAAGEDFILEDRLRGDEASITVITDGKEYRMFHPSTDHKRRFDNDKGENTGGMGVYAPTKVVPPKLERMIEREIVKPTIRGLRKDGIDYKGVLYLAIMVQDGQPYLIEYNCRFGDPETQAIVPLIDADPFDTMMDCIHGRLGKHPFKRRDAYSCSVILVHKDYPAKRSRGRRIDIKELPESMDDVVVFHAGTMAKKGRVYTNGGRILAVTAVSEDGHAAAIRRAYQQVEDIRFKDRDYRHDIGRSAL